MIPLFKPSCSDEEVEAVTRVLRSGWWGMGPETEAFEAEFAEFTSTRYAVSVSSGTMALELAARATGLTGGTVVVPALTFVSTALSMQHAGNKVLFADIDEKTLCMDRDEAYYISDAMRVHGQPVGIVPVWYGGSVPWGIRYVPDGVTLIEDCAHAAGSVHAGKIGDASAWSFHAVKNLGAGDGGMVTTNDEGVAREVKRLRWCGIDKSTWDRDKDSRVGYGWDYDIPGNGYKAHMNDLSSALGRVQLKHLAFRNSLRRTIVSVYNMEFASIPWLRTPRIDRNSSAHLYAIRVPAEDRQRFIRHCIENGVSAGVHYKPLTYYKALFGYEPEPPWLPVTNRVWKTLVTLPLFPDMTNGELEQVTTAVKSFKPTPGASL